MERLDGQNLAFDHLEPYRQRTYEDLSRLLDASDHFEGKTGDGVGYRGEVEAHWDDRSRQNLRVICTVSWGGWSDFHPASVAFIMAPDGSFVGERGRLTSGSS